MARKQYSKSDIKKFIEENPQISDIISKKSNIVEEDDFLKIDNKVIFIKQDNKWIPHLKLLLQKPDLLPKVTVDMGAVKFVVNGADIMRPGITASEEFEKDSFVVIVDETHGKPLSVCLSMLSSEELMAETSGKVLKNLHYVGDELWSK